MATETQEVELEPGQDVLTVRFPAISAGWEQWVLHITDAHWDNPHCDRQLLTKHLRQAQERNALVFSYGDWFCLMQGKYDPRANKDNIRPEHQTGNYIDAVVDTATDYLEPYPIALLALGNHETSILSKLETDVTQRLTNGLRSRGKNVHALGYSGFIRFMFSQRQGKRSSKVLYFHHGSGGGGPVTKGVIRSNRQAAYVDADYIIGGHVHEQWLLVAPRLRLSSSGHWYLDDQYHLCSATYKQEFDLAGGFHVERGRPPKPLGGWWQRFYYDKSQRGYIGTEFTLAK